MSQIILQSEDYFLQSLTFQNQLDIVANSITNLAVNNATRVTTLADLVIVINDLRDMDTSVWAFVWPAAAQTFPTYAVANKISRGPYLSNTNHTQAGLMIASLLPIVQNISDVLTVMTATPFIVSEVPGTENQIYPIQAAWTNAYTDALAKLAVVITDIPLLTAI